MERDFALGAIEQAADEINCIQQALNAGAVTDLICCALIGVEARLRAAAGLAGDVELALDAGDGKPEVQR